MVTTLNKSKLEQIAEKNKCEQDNSTTKRCHLINGVFGTFLLTILYSLMSFMNTVNFFQNTLHREQFHQDIGNEKKVTIMIKGFEIDIFEFFEKGARLFNYAGIQSYYKIRAKAFEIAGVDPTNPLHDKKRFEFYRQLGVAVLETDKDSIGIYVPYETFVDYIKKNSDYELGNLEDLKDDRAARRYRYQVGKVFYKADSSSEGGNEDGVVSNDEWNNALTKMGLRPIDNVVNETVRLAREGLDDEVNKIILNINNDPDIIFQKDEMASLSRPNVRSKLEAYLNR